MCLDPKPMRVEIDGYPMIFPRSCGGCWQCRKRIVDDYVGRCLCEAAHSDWFLCATFTYRDSAERDRDGAHRVLNPVHFPAAIKRLRKRGHVFRYFVVGEYGSAGHRSHFHAMFFGKSKPFGWSQGWNYPREWPHGHVDVDLLPDERAIRYCTKYLLKADPACRWFSLSKKPVLGWAFFRDAAVRDASLGALPADFSYRPPGADVRRRYYMTGAARREYLRVYSDLRPDVWSDRWFSANDFQQRSLDKLARWQRLRDEGPMSAAEFDADFFARTQQWRRPKAPVRNYLDELEDRALVWEYTHIEG